MKNIFLFLFLGLALALFSCTKRKPQEMDYAPNSPFNPYPPDSATNIEHTTLDVTLRWTATDPNSGQSLTYDVYLDTINPPLDSKIASGLTSPSYFLTGLSYNTTYYWKLYITDDKGAITSGPVWQFTTLPHANTAPNIPTDPNPANNASWQYPTLSLSWNCTDPEGGSDTLYYDLYLGVTPQLPPRPYENNTFSILEFTGLNYTTTYYWKIVVHDNHYAYTSSPIYSFSTRDCPWFYKSSLPSPRYGFGTAVVNNKIYVVGGYDGLNYLSEVLEYDPALDNWTRKADMPTARSDLAVAVWEGKIYAIGGHNNLAIYDLNEVYDPQDNTWSTLAPLPQQNYIFTAQAVNGKIFTVGGLPDANYPFGRLSDINFPRGPVFEYDIATDDWWDTTVYYVYLDSIIRIDTVYILWRSQMPDFSYRLAFCSALNNTDIYLFGGDHLVSEVNIYHTGTNSWSTAAPMIGPASYAAAATGNGFIYVLGGYGNGFLRRVRKYDPVTDTWFIRSDMQDPRSYFGAAFINNRIYAFGGTSGFLLSTVEEYLIELDPKHMGR